MAQLWCHLTTTHYTITQDDDVAIQTDWNGMGPTVYGGIHNMMVGV
jgi:hypothetical protein